MAHCIIAFDFGTKSIGVAVGQSITQSGSELPPLPAQNGTPNWDTIENLLNEWKPQLVLVGLPLNMDGTTSDFAMRANKFGKRLHGRFGIQVEMVDERLSTFEAKAEAHDRGHKGNYAEKPIDSIAARLILESWFQQV